MAEYSFPSCALYFLCGKHNVCFLQLINPVRIVLEPTHPPLSPPPLSCRITRPFSVAIYYTGDKPDFPRGDVPIEITHGECAAAASVSDFSIGLRRILCPLLVPDGARVAPVFSSNVERNYYRGPIEGKRDCDRSFLRGGRPHHRVFWERRTGPLFSCFFLRDEVPRPLRRAVSMLR